MAATKYLSLTGLTTYDTKIKEYIGSAISGKLTTRVVAELPQTGEENVIYLVPNSGSGTNVKDEYMWINNQWELIGTTEVDLSNYATKTYAQEQAAEAGAAAEAAAASDATSKANAAQQAAEEYADGLAEDKQDTITDLATIRSGAAAGATAVQPADLVAITTAEINALFA